jgi:hypothetical protein
MENLDLRCAKLGKTLAEQKNVDDPLLTNALAVLEEQGVYAFFLYLQARGKEPEKAMSRACEDFLKRTPAALPLLKEGDVWQALQQLAENLDNLLFARDLLCQALVYGRYHAKACTAPRGER